MSSSRTIGQFQSGYSQVPRSIPLRMPAFCHRSSNIVVKGWQRSCVSAALEEPQRKEDPLVAKYICVSVLRYICVFEIYLCVALVGHSSFIPFMNQSYMGMLIKD
jgi:hypothetical protein